MDDDIIDITDYSERSTNGKRSPRPRQTDTTQMTTQGHCPTLQNSPTYLPMNAVAAAPAKPHRTEVRRILSGKRKVPHGWPAWFEKAATQGSISKIMTYIWSMMKKLTVMKN